MVACLISRSGFMGVGTRPDDSDSWAKRLIRDPALCGTRNAAMQKPEFYFGHQRLSVALHE